MTEKFNHKYRIPSARLKNWDYRSDGAYFITLCVRNRDCVFGEISDARFIASAIGLFAEKYWLEIPQHFPFVELGVFVVMPNHFHGILILDKSKIGHHNAGAGTDLKTDGGLIVPSIPTPISISVSAKIKEMSPACIDKSEKMAKISPKSGAISTIIRSYKSVVTKNAHLVHPDFDWQTRFYDHIIRNSKSFENIQNYIETNPANWCKDKFYQ